MQKWGLCTVLGILIVVMLPSVCSLRPSNYDYYDYEHQNAAYTAYFRNNTNTAHALRIERDGYYFIYDISGSNLQYHGKPGQPAVTDTLGGGASSNTLDTKLTYSGKTVYYDNAFSYTNISYELYDTQIKETFRLLQIPNLKTEYDYLEYTGHVYFNKSLQICDDIRCYVPSGTQDNFNTSGRIYFKTISNESNVTEFTLREPIIRDSAGHETRGIYFVYGSDAQMRFDLRIPVSWLATAVYPVYIDPTYDVTGCTENSTTIYCNSTMTGTYIHTDKIIDFDGASWSHTFSGGDTNYVWINSTTKIIMRNNVNIDMSGSQDTGPGDSVWIIIRAPDVDISGASTVVHAHGAQACWPSCNPSGSGAGYGYIQIDAVNLTINAAQLYALGGTGYSSDGNPGHGPGDAKIWLTSPNINLSNAAYVLSQGGSHSGTCTHGEGGAPGNLYVYPYNNLFSGYGYSGKNKATITSTTLTALAGTGSGSGCVNSYARTEILNGQEFLSYSSTLTTTQGSGTNAVYGYFKMYNFDTIYFEKSQIALTGMQSTSSNITFNGTDAKLGLFNTTQNLQYIDVKSLNDNNLTLGWYTTNDYQNFTFSVAYINKTFAEFFNDIPQFTSHMVNATIPHEQNYDFDVNCTDEEGDTITYYDNTSLFDINSGTGVISDNPTAAETGSYSILITCGDLYGNVTQDFIYTITNAAPAFTQNLTYQSLHHNVDLSYDVNCTDANSDTITYYDNTSLFDINSGTGLISDNATIFEAGNYSIQITCGDGYLNTSQTFNYAIINDVPTIASFLFSPAANDGTYDVTANYTTADTENDTVYSWSEWWLNNVYMPAWDNQFTIGEANFSNGDTLKIRLLIGDLGINATKINYSLTINDSVPPVMTVSVSSTAITLNSQGYLYGTCTDIASSISNVKFYLIDPDLILNTYTVGTAYNGSTYRQAITFNKLGIWSFVNTSCTDTASNIFTNNSVGIEILVSNVVNETNPGAGGGGATRTTIVVGQNATEELLGITCGNSICDKNENPGNCFQDCPINIDTLLSGQTFGQFWFAQTLVIFIIGIIGYFMWKSAKKR